MCIAIVSEAFVMKPVTWMLQSQRHRSGHVRGICDSIPANSSYVMTESRQKANISQPRPRHRAVAAAIILETKSRTDLRAEATYDVDIRDKQAHETVPGSGSSLY